MKNTTLISLLCGLSMVAGAFAQTETPLPAPQKEGGMPIYEAFNKRRTIRDMDKVRELEPQMLANLLWAANGINDEKGHRTVPTARNLQEYEIMVLMPSGVYSYDAHKHSLIKQSDENLLPTAQAFGSTEIVFVGNTHKQPSGKYLAVDAGYISQNIYLFCAANNLGSCVRATFPVKELSEKLNLPEGYVVTFVHDVGYKAQ